MGQQQPSSRLRGWFIARAACQALDPSMRHRSACFRSGGWAAASARRPVTGGVPTLFCAGSRRLGWCAAVPADDPRRDLLDLYLPISSANASRPIIVGHLGQSLDGFIATSSGDACFVTGPQNILHLHRLRALCDAVIVGARTVENDNPRLTTRLVSGDNPCCVVLDPNRRLADSHHVFSDGDATTVRVTGRRWHHRGARRSGRPR